MSVLSTLISRNLLRRVWKRANEDDILGRASQLSYYFLLALFPFLLFLITLFGYFSGTSSELRRELIKYLSSVVPGSAVRLVVVMVDEITQARGGGKLSLGLLAALWAASSGMGAIGETLNHAYGVGETRPWWKVRLVSVALTIALSILIISALALVLYGGQLGQVLAASIGLGNAFTVTWAILQWPIALLFVFISFSLIYHFAPDLSAKNRDQRFAAAGVR